jgi:hypothetical protein
MACWQYDQTHRHRPFNQDKLEKYGEAFRDQGIDVWVWGYPHAGMEEAFVDTMRRSADLAGASGILIDPELSYKEEAGAARKLVELTIDSLDESLGLGVTSYGIPAYHPTFPWSSFAGYGWGSPQLYTATPHEIRKGLGEWKGAGWEHIVPSVPAFGRRQTSEFRQYINRFVGVPGIIFWSWRQLQSNEWRVIAEMEGRFE